MPQISFQAVPNDRSVTLVGGTSTVVCAPNNSRKYLLIANSGSTIIWINILGGTATGAAPNIPLAQNGVFVMETGFISTAQISIVCASGQSVTVLEYS